MSLTRSKSHKQKQQQPINNFDSNKHGFQPIVASLLLDKQLRFAQISYLDFYTEITIHLESTIIFLDRV